MILLLLSSCIPPAPSPRESLGKGRLRYAVYYGDSRQEALMKGRDWAIVSDT